jgi:hypothetical protein
VLRNLCDSLEKANEANESKAHWLGYVKSRNVPSNPPPGM